MCASQKPGSTLRISCSFSTALAFMPRSISTIARPYIFLASFSSVLAAGPSCGRIASSASSAAGAGGHAFWEWGTRGAPATEVARMHRVLTAALIVSGFHAADGTVVQPSVGPIGQRTREVVR